MRIFRLTGLAAATVLLAASLTDVAADAAPSADFAVTDDGAYTRHDGGTDQAIRHCGNRPRVSLMVRAKCPAPQSSRSSRSTDVTTT